MGRGPLRGLAGLRALPMEEHADFVLGGELNDLSDLLWIKADHGTGVVAHGFGGEHEGLADDADGAKGFIVLELGLIFVKLVDHGTMVF